MSDVKLRNVIFRYPSGTEAVKGVSLEIRSGEKVAILGQNGAGKTTTVKMMNNLLRPSEGDVLIGDKNTKDFTTAQIARDVGYVFQNPDDQIFHATVAEEVAYGPKVALGLDEEEATRRCERGIRLSGLWDLRDENPFDLPLSVRKFVAIASIIAMDPSVYIFDEPTAGQDRGGLELLQTIVDVLHADGKTVITITHDVEFAVTVFERIVVMCQGEVIRDGSAADVFYDDEVVQRARLKAPCTVRLTRDLGLMARCINEREFVEAFAHALEMSVE